MVTSPLVFISMTQTPLLAVLDLLDNIHGYKLVMLDRLSTEKITRGLLYEQLHFEFVISLLRTEEKLKKSSIRREESTVQKSSSGFEHAIHIPFDVPFIARLKKVPDSSLCLKKSTRTSIMRGL